MELEQAVTKLTRIERDTILLLLLFTLLCGLITRSWAASLSLMLGGVLMLTNFHFLWRFARRVFEKESKNKARFLVGIFLMFFVFLGAVAVSVLYLNAPILPFFAGTLSLIASIVLHGVFLS